MTKHIKGAPVRNWQDLVDCLHAGHMLWIDQCILPSGQLRTWTFARLNEKMALGKIWRAVLPAPDIPAIASEIGVLAMQHLAGWVDYVTDLIGPPLQEVADAVQLFITINEDPARYTEYVRRQWRGDVEAAFTSINHDGWRVEHV